MTWKIGEVTKRTGLTARALHFYEDQGLIGPISRNVSGHRIYKQSDLLRLQQIRTLRQLGISLADMPPLLSDAEQLVPQLKLQLSKLHLQRDAIQRTEVRLVRLIEKLEKRSLPQGELDETIFQTLECMTMYENYFNQSEINAMHKELHTAGSNESIEDVWSQWVDKMQSFVSSGIAPQSKEVQELMQLWDAMINHLVGNDDKKLKDLNDLLHNEPQARKDHGISDELFEFMAKASAGH